MDKSLSAKMLDKKTEYIVKAHEEYDRLMSEGKTPEEALDDGAVKYWMVKYETMGEAIRMLEDLKAEACRLWNLI